MKMKEEEEGREGKTEGRREGWMEEGKKGKEKGKRAWLVYTGIVLLQYWCLIEFDLFKKNSTKERFAGPVLIVEMSFH